MLLLDATNKQSRSRHCSIGSIGSIGSTGSIESTGSIASSGSSSSSSSGSSAHFFLLFLLPPLLPALRLRHVQRRGGSSRALSVAHERQRHRRARHAPALCDPPPNPAPSRTP